MSNTFRRTLRPHGVLAGVGLVAALAALLMASLSPAKAATKPPFKVLMVNSFSGPLAGVGKTESAGMRAAINVVNRSGGINGSKVELTTKDDGGDGAKATAAALQETSATTYNLVFCGAVLAVALPCAPAIDKTAGLKISGTQDASYNKLSRTFGVGSLYEPIEESVVLYMIKKKVKSFAIIAPDNASGRACSPALAGAARKHKKQITLTKTVLVPPTVADATPQVQSAMASNPQAIVHCALGNLAALRARKKLGLNIPVYTDWLFNTGSLNSLTAEERSGVTVQGWPFMFKGNKATKTKAFSAFAAEFNKEFGPGAVPLAIPAAVTAWNTLMLARAAAKQAKSIDGAKMAKAMPKLTKISKVPGFFGVKTLYTKHSHNPKGDPTSWIFQKAGTTGTDGYVVPGT